MFVFQLLPAGIKPCAFGAGGIEFCLQFAALRAVFCIKFRIAEYRFQFGNGIIGGGDIVHHGIEFTLFVEGEFFGFVSGGFVHRGCAVFYGSLGEQVLLSFPPFFQRIVVISGGVKKLSIAAERENSGADAVEETTKRTLEALEI